MTKHVVIAVSPGEVGMRLDSFLAGHAAIPRSLAATLIRDGRIALNGRATKPSFRVAAGDAVTGEIAYPPALSAVPERLPLAIVYQDADMAVIDKPAGMVVHPAAGHPSGTVANALMAHFPDAAEVGSPERPGIVHRLDKDTSGLMVIALNDVARRHLQHQIASRSAGRRYRALATGHVRPTLGQIDAPIGRDPDNRKRMWIYGIGQRSARTHYSVVEELPGFSFVEVRLETGRTHQIRVHFAAMGHPLAGDVLYRGQPVPGLSRQFLHAAELHLRSPSTDRELKFHSRLPPDLERVLASLRQTSR